MSYAEDIAPMLIDNCVTCHREGGIGPWAMTGYNMVRGFAPMIREVVRTKRMPPWHADPVHGVFTNDRSLSTDEVRKLVHWVETGAPRGDGPDPLATLDAEWPDWGLGEPDLIVDIPAFDVPATGVVEYQYQRVVNPLDRDVWVRATEILPGDRAALHHVIATFRHPKPDGTGFGRRGGGLGGYVPGAETRGAPDEHRDVPACGRGAHLPDALHALRQSGDGSLEVRPLLPRLATETPTRQRRADEYAHPDPAQHQVAQRIRRTDVRPRCPALQPAAARALPWHGLGVPRVLPGWGRGVLLSVPNYDFNWQTTYVLEEPKVLPAGTRVVHTTWWDNSAQNPANPDPNREVPWGRQSWDEMLFGSLRLRYLDDEIAQATGATEEGGASD